MTIGATGHRIAAALLAAAGVAALAGCANSGDSGTVTTASPSAAPPPVSTPSATSAAPTTTAAIAACGPRQLEIGAQAMSPGMLHRGVELSFTLVADTPPCTISGYPGADTGEGGPVLHAERTPRGYMGGLPQGDDTPPVVTVLPGRPARAVVEGSAMGPDGKDCPLYTSLAVTAPNSTDTRTLHTTIDTCALQVHPVTG
ncbi:DUF4232 domain-containing protein [Nocardia nova]|uniref:DUF4232 domain-containing protein n=1 Tax=Nocardia nova TaxID=37330 RepID=UPI003407397B